MSYILRRPRHHDRYLFTTRPSQLRAWPFAFSRYMRGARRFAKWASRNGAMVHPALRLTTHPDRQRDPNGCGVITLRPLPAGTTVMSVPTRLTLTTTREDRSELFLGVDTPIQQLSQMLVRGLYDSTCSWGPYLELLHDLYNHSDDDEDSQLHPMWKRDLDVLLHGNYYHAKGVLNGPFLEKRAVQSPLMRLLVGESKELVRQLEQSLPRHAATAAGWAVSMALSRAWRDDGDGELTMIPLLDLVNHDGDDPSCHVVVTATAEQQRAARSGGTSSTSLFGLIGDHHHSHVPMLSSALPPSLEHTVGVGQTLLGAETTPRLTSSIATAAAAAPAVHLVTRRVMAAGEEVTLQYSSGPTPWLQQCAGLMSQGRRRQRASHSSTQKNEPMKQSHRVETKDAWLVQYGMHVEEEQEGNERKSRRELQNEIQECLIAKAGRKQQ